MQLHLHAITTVTLNLEINCIKINLLCVHSKSIVNVSSLFISKIYFIQGNKSISTFVSCVTIIITHPQLNVFR